MVGFSAPMAATDRAIKDFLWTNMYRHQRVITVMEEAEVVVRELFARFFVSPQDMPPEVGRGAPGARCALARAAGRRFHCRNDRSLCADRASAAVSESS
jgi:dGTP triphosphohydrolase